MLPLHDYIAALAEFRRRGRRFGLVIFGCFLAWFAIMGGGVWFKKPGQDNWIVLGASFVPLLAGVALTVRLLRGDARMICPHCRNLQQRLGAWAIATRHCGSCGRRMLDEPAPTASDGVGLLSEEEIRVPAQVEIRRELTWVIVAIVTAIGFFGVAAALIVWARTRWSDGAAEWLPLAIVGPTLLIVEYVIWLRWGSRRMDRSLRCPHCAEALVEVCGVVLATGNCGHCGRRVMTQAPAPTAAAAAAPMAVEEFRQLARRWTAKFSVLLVTGVFGTLGGLLLGGWIAAWFPGGERRPPEGIGLAMMFIPAVAMCVLIFVLIALHTRHRDPRLNCPDCKQDLMSKHIEIIIATGRCPQCRRRLLEAPALPVP